jgi:hypothetical protein
MATKKERLPVQQARAGADDGIPESLRVENRKPLTPEQAALRDAAMANRGNHLPCSEEGRPGYRHGAGDQRQDRGEALRREGQASIVKPIELATDAA